MQNRQNALKKWLKQTLPSHSFSLSPLAGDASFRRYFRLHQHEITHVVMDAPPQKEALESFLMMSDLLQDIGIKTPTIHAVDKAKGFVILEDFGDELLLKHLSAQTADELYGAALSIILTMQQQPKEQLPQLPYFDKQFMLQELAIFKTWFLQTYLNIPLTLPEEKLLENTFHWLVEEVAQQPQGLIHRDYHSRNIMLLNRDGPKLGIIDFQDAMWGPYTYDLVSLFKDCYVQWPCEKVISWLTSFHEQSHLTTHTSFPTFVRAFDLCGLQRHLKVLGVFSRLYLRDDKPNYLKDLPLTFHYVMSCLEEYEELQSFYQFMQERVQLP